MQYICSNLIKNIEVIVKELFRFENKIINYKKNMKTYHERTTTGDPRLMRISLLRFFKTFQKYLAYAFFWLIISLLPFFYYKQNIEKPQ